MSDGSEKLSEPSESGSENGIASDICRDFLRNVCRRGKRCKYRHPGEPQSSECKKISEYTFCHDYQNNGCNRPNCKFLHCTREEEDHARLTGELPPRVVQAASIGIGVDHAEMVAKGGVPLCKDFLKGECHRGQQCKYRHISSAEYEFLQRQSEGREHGGKPEPRFERFDTFEPDLNIKRRRLDHDFPNDGFRQFDNRYPPISPPISRPLSYQLIEEENIMLRKKIDDLKKQVADLTATNEVLLEQNARYRVSKSTVLQTLNTSGVHSTFQAPAFNHINANLAQQMALNGDLTSLTQQQQHQVLQRIVHEAAALAATRCSIAGQHSLNSVALSMNPSSIVPVSIPQSVSAIQQNNNQTLTQNIPDMNTPLVSYPITSQGMRMSAGNVAH